MIAAMIAAALSGCSTLTGKTDDKVKPITSEFLGGNIKVSYTSNGEFESMASSHTIRLTSALPYAQD